MNKKKKFNRIYIEITNNCNLSCSFCKNSKRQKKEMTKEEFEYILKQVQDYTNTICLHVKGEPLLHKNLDEILTLCDEYNINVSLTTNGTLLKSKINVLKRHKCISKIHISLNSENNFKKYLEYIFESVEKLDRDKIIIYRIWALREGLLDEKSTKIVEKIAQHYNLSTEIVNKIKTTKNTKIDFNKYVDKNYLFEWPTINTENNDGFCEGLKSQLAILSNGTVTACCLDDDGLINLGNIYRETLDVILEKENTKRIIEGFRNNKCVSPLCKSCTYKNRFK